MRIKASDAIRNVPINKWMSVSCVETSAEKDTKMSQVSVGLTNVQVDRRSKVHYVIRNVAATKNRLVAVFVGKSAGQGTMKYSECVGRD